MKDDYTDVFDILPINEDRQKELIKLSQGKDFRALLFNALLSTLNTAPKTELENIVQNSEARAIAKLLTTTLKPKKIGI